MRSHRLAPGQRTVVDIWFQTTFDGPGRHGEGLRFMSNDPADRAPNQLRSDLGFFIAVDSPSLTGAP